MIYNAKSDISGTISPFNYRKKITISHSGSLTAYQVKLVVDHVNTNMRTDFGDIRFNTDTGNYVPYWIESKTDDISTNVWIKADLVDGNTTIYMYYGNTGLTSDSNGTNTFAMFDDFSSDVFTDIGTGFGTANGRFEFSSNRNTANDLSYRNISIASGDNIEAKFKVNITSSATNAIIFIGFSDTTTQWDIYTTNGFGLYLQGQFGIIQTSLTKRESNVQTNSSVYNINFSTDYIVKLRRNGSNITYELWNSSESSLLSTLTNTITGVAYSNFKIADYDGDEAGGYTMVGIVDNLSIRKYTITEPTVTTSAEQTITAKSMTISPTESPCRMGICTVNITVTWTNTGESVTFTPKIIADSTTYSLTPRTLPTGDTPTAFEVSGLPVGNHVICPDPN